MKLLSFFLAQLIAFSAFAQGAQPELFGGAAASKPVCTPDIRGKVFVSYSDTGAEDKSEICLKGKSEVYGWQSLDLLTDGLVEPHRASMRFNDLDTPTTITTAGTSDSQRVPFAQIAAEVGIDVDLTEETFLITKTADYLVTYSVSFKLDAAPGDVCNQAGYGDNTNCQIDFFLTNGVVGPSCTWTPGTNPPGATCQAVPPASQRAVTVSETVNDVVTVTSTQLGIFNANDSLHLRVRTSEQVSGDTLTIYAAVMSIFELAPRSYTWGTGDLASNTSAVAGTVLYSNLCPPVTLTTQLYGGTISNSGCIAGTYTLGNCTAGQSFTLLDMAGVGPTIDPDASDRIELFTNAAGDRITGDSVAGTSITLLCDVNGNWWPMGYTGGWIDAN